MSDKIHNNQSINQSIKRIINKTNNQSINQTNKQTNELSICLPARPLGEGCFDTDRPPPIL